MTTMEPGEHALPYTHPSSFYFEITNRCNMNCIYCYAPTGTEEITVEQMRDVLIPQLDEAKAGSLCFIGGEPLLRLDDILEIAPDVCAIETIKEIVIATNGYFLTEEAYKKLARAFDYPGKLLYFSIPLDSWKKDVVMRNRPPKEDVFERTMAAIKLLKKKGAIFTIETVVTKDTLDDLEEMIRFVKKLGNRVAMEIYPYYPVQPEKTHEHLMLNKEEMQRLDEIRLRYLGYPLLPVDNMPCPYDPDILKKIEPLMNKYTIIERGCTAGNRALGIEANGDIVPCNYVRVKLGNIFETTIMDMYRTHPFVKKSLNREVGGKCGICKYKVECGGCRARSKIETGDWWGGVTSCESCVDFHVHEDIANEMLAKCAKKYGREIKLFELYTKMKRLFKKKRS